MWRRFGGSHPNQNANGNGPIISLNSYGTMGGGRVFFIVTAILVLVGIVWSIRQYNMLEELKNQIETDLQRLYVRSRLFSKREAKFNREKKLFDETKQSQLNNLEACLKRLTKSKARLSEATAKVSKLESDLQSHKRGISGGCALV